MSRGFASETFCFEAVEPREDADRPYVVYYVGDCDRAGHDAAGSLQEKLERFAAVRGVTIIFQHLAVKPDDILDADADKALVYLLGLGSRWLPTREPKRISTADKNWPHSFALEFDAIAPDDLRAVVQTAIEHHLPAEPLRILKIAEESERELIRGWVGKVTGDEGES